MILGVDIDNTIAATQQAAVEVFNEFFQRDVSVEEVNTFHLDQFYGLTAKEGAKMWRKLEDRIYDLGLPLEQAPETLEQLVKSGHQVYFITARPGMPKIQAITRDWLVRHNFPYDGKNLFMGAQNKALVAREVGVQLFFEDAPAHLDKLVQGRIPTVIVDAVYNRDYPHPLPRIRSWAEVKELVDRKNYALS